MRAIDPVRYSGDRSEAPVAFEAAAPPRFSCRRAYAQTFTATVAIRALGIASGILAARLLGPAGRGELAVIIFLPTLLISVGELELPRSLAFEVSKLPSVPPAVVATGVWLALGLAAVQMLVLLLLLPIYLPADKLHLLPACNAFAIYLLATYTTLALTGIDQGRGRFGRFSFLLVLPGFAYVLAIGAVWAAGLITPEAFAFGILLGALITMLVRGAMDWQAIVRVRPSGEIAKRVLRRGMAFYVPALAGLLLMRADMFLLVRLASTTAIGLYAVAQAIALGQIGTLTPFVQVAFAAVAGQSEPQYAYETLTRHFRVAQVTMVTVALATAAVTPWLIRFLFGPRFMAAVPTTYFLVGATACWGMEQVLEQGLRAAGHPRLGIVSNVLGLALLLGFGIPACLRFGVNGMAAVLFVAQAANLMILIVVAARKVNISFRKFWGFDGATFRQLASAAAGLGRNFYGYVRVL